MNQFFLPYKLSILARGKGFKDMCLGYYYPDVPNELYHAKRNVSTDPIYLTKNSPSVIEAPLYEQIIDWLDMEHGILVQVIMDITGSYYWQIGSLHPESTYKGDWKMSVYVSNRKQAWLDGIETALNLLP